MFEQEAVKIPAKTRQGKMPTNKWTREELILAFMNLIVWKFAKKTLLMFLNVQSPIF